MVKRRVVLIGIANTIVIAAAKADTGGVFALLDYELAPGCAGLPPHIHDNEDEAVYVLEGRLLVRLGETERLLCPGGFVYLPRQIVHSQRNPGLDPARFLMLLIPAGSEQCFPDLEAILRDSIPLTLASIATVMARHGMCVQRDVRAGLT